jgi:hypothetical protein
MKDEDFKKTLAFGNSFEEELKTLIPHKECIQSIKGEYDLILDGVKYEVKADRNMFKTGNVIIEYESNKKASGISITEADYYAIFELETTFPNLPDVTTRRNVSYELYLIPVQDIKQLISEKNYSRKISCGYNKLSQCYLFSKMFFEKYSQEIKG